MEGTITLILKPSEDTKRSARPIFLMNMNAEILTILRNLTAC